MSKFTIDATKREERGTGASRRLRNAKQMPAIIYGKDKEPVSITIEHAPFFHMTEKDGFFDSDITINVGSTKETVRVTDLQRHPFKEKVLHADFIRV
jgi:large subunit ribosomal protein L25